MHIYIHSYLHVSIHTHYTRPRDFRFAVGTAIAAYARALLALAECCLAIAPIPISHRGVVSPPSVFV